MAGPDEDPLLQRCLVQQVAAITALEKLPPEDPVCQELLGRSIAGDNLAGRVILKTAKDSPVRLEWNQKRLAIRNSALEGWRKRHEAFVKSVLRRFLNRFPDDVEDVAQEFWTSFWWNSDDVKYDPARVTEHHDSDRGDGAVAKERTYIFVKARAKAFDHLRSAIVWVELDPLSPVVESLPSVHSGLIRYLTIQIATNRIKPHVAIVRLCAKFAALGPTDLTRDHLHSTLSDLWGIIERELSFAQDPEMGKLVRVIRDQLSLPPGHPLGDRTLAQLVNERASGGDGRNKDREPAEVLQNWVDDAKRILDRDIEAPDLARRERLADEVLKRVEQETKHRLDFLVKSGCRASASEFRLVWAWRTILNMPLEYLAGMTCLQTATILAQRVRHLVPGYVVPVAFFEELAGICPEKCIAQRLEALGVNAGNAEKKIEKLYQEASKEPGK